MWKVPNEDTTLKPFLLMYIFSPLLNNSSRTYEQEDELHTIYMVFLQQLTFKWDLENQMEYVNTLVTPPTWVVEGPNFVGISHRWVLMQIQKFHFNLKVSWIYIMWTFIFRVESGIQITTIYISLMFNQIHEATQEHKHWTILLQGKYFLALRAHLLIIKRIKQLLITTYLFQP